MMTVDDVRDAIAAELNDRFGERFTTVAANAPSKSLKEIKGATVLVVSRSVVITPLTRMADQHAYEVDVGLFKKLGPEAESDDGIDAGKALMQEIVDHMARRSFGAARYAGTRLLLYIPEHVEQNRQFSSVATFVYKVTR